MKVSFTEEQFNLVRNLLSKHYDEIATQWVPVDREASYLAYKAMIAMRVPMAEKAWEEYCEMNPDLDWSFYSSKEEFFKDQFTIYPEDLVTV